MEKSHVYFIKNAMYWEHKKDNRESSRASYLIGKTDPPLATLELDSDQRGWAHGIFLCLISRVSQLPTSFFSPSNRHR